MPCVAARTPGREANTARTAGELQQRGELLLAPPGPSGRRPRRFILTGAQPCGSGRAWSRAPRGAIECLRGSLMVYSERGDPCGSLGLSHD
jgi:hypothetical protein